LLAILSGWIYRLGKICKIVPIYTATQWESLDIYEEGDNCWHDTVLIAEKKNKYGARDALRRLLTQFCRRL